MPADDVTPADPLTRRTSRRAFITSAAIGAAFLAGCAANDSAAPSTSVRSAPPAPPTPPPAPPSTLAPPTVPSTLPPTVPPTLPPTTVATTQPPMPLPSSDRWWLDGNFGPVAGDIESANLAVTGALPAALAGTWVRNGSNPDGESPHWFIGNGMVHGLRIRDGRAEWYRRRAVETPYLLDPAAGIPGGPISYSNVSSVFHAGRLLSLGELGFPYELDVDDLSTVGPYDFAGRLTASSPPDPADRSAARSPAPTPASATRSVTPTRRRSRAPDVVSV